MDNEEVVIDTPNNEGEGVVSDEVKLSKTEYEELIGYKTTAGSLKREIKDLKKSQEKPIETPKTNQPDVSPLLEKLEKMSLRQAGISHQDDMELARNTAKKWGMDIDEVLADEDFKVKLERQQTNRANIEATSGVKGSAGQSQAKNTVEYWKAKGVPPTPTDIPDRKTRQKIVREFINLSKNNGKKFYND